MKPFGGVRVLVGLSIVFALLQGESRPMAVQPPEPDLIGDWVGIFQSSVNPKDVGFFDVLITSQKNRRFTCRLTIMSTPPIPCDGTLAASGEFSVIARRGGFQVNHGMYMDLGDGAAIADAEYRIGRDVGTLQLLRKTDQPPDPGLFTSFSGEFVSETTGIEGMIDLSLNREGGKEGFDGVMNIVETIQIPGQDSVRLPFSFDVFVSSVPPPVGDSPRDPNKAMHSFAIVGLATKGPGAFVVTGDIGNDGFMASGEFMYYPAGIANMDMVDMGMFDIFHSGIIGDISSPQ